MSETLQKRPLPPLEESIANYLENIRPLISESEFNTTAKYCDDFLHGAGPSLHSLLEQIEKDPDEDNWHAGFWDSVYLRPREPLPINSSPFFAVADQECLAGLTVQAIAAKLIVATNATIRSIRDDSIAPEYAKGVVQDMGQYRRFFGYTRHPQPGRDQKLFNLESDSIVVLCRNRLFLLRVFDKDSRSLAVEALEKSLAEIVSQCSGQNANHNYIGFLTSDDRDYWAQRKNEIVAICPQNSEAMQAIDQSLYCLCLDEAPASGLTELATGLLHNKGENRFFDKYQIIIFGNGKIGSLFEHAPVDALSVGRIWNETISHLLHPSQVNGAEAGINREAATATELAFEYTPNLLAAISTSGDKFRRLANRTRIDTLLFSGFGTSLIKALGVSPDACIQLLFQLSYYNAFGRIENTYESVSTRQFREGRTDVLRPVTAQSKEFIKRCRAQSEPEAMRLLKAAVDSIVQRRSIAARGESPDHHLAALYQLAQQKQNNSLHFEMPTLFKDPAYRLYTRSIISTSNISDPLCLMFGFGPVTPEGMGIAYGTYPQHLIFHLSFFDDSDARLGRYKTELLNSLQYLHQLMGSS
jgi:hypothetical protein